MTNISPSGQIVCIALKYCHHIFAFWYQYFKCFSLLLWNDSETSHAYLTATIEAYLNMWCLNMERGSICTKQYQQARKKSVWAMCILRHLWQIRRKKKLVPEKYIAMNWLQTSTFDQKQDYSLIKYLYIATTFPIAICSSFICFCFLPQDSMCSPGRIL